MYPARDFSTCNEIVWLWSKVSDNIQSPNWHCVCHFNIYIYNASQGVIGFSWLHPLPIWIQCTIRKGFSKCRQIYDICILDGMDTGWWFQVFFIFTPTWGRFPFWRAYFSDGLKPPSRIACFLFEIIFNALDPGLSKQGNRLSPRSVGGHDQHLLSCAPCRASPPVCCANLRTCGGFTGWPGEGGDGRLTS